jgi:serine/arginine repetitive matrix protein 2
MPLSDRDPNTSGRNSRASHLSTGSKGAIRRSHPSQQPTTHHGYGPKNRASDGMLSAAPGVLGMLRTTMEIGDVGSLALPSNRSKPASHYGHGYHRGYNRRSGATSRMSGGSANSQPFDGPRHRGWPSVSSAGRRRSITSNVTAPPFLEPGPAPPSSIGSYSFVTMGDRPESPPMLPYGRRPVSRPVSISGRSLSMTSNSTPHGHSLTNYRSLSSLRGNGQREGYPRPQSPFHYPTRLKRPGYRPSSPALSDVTGGLSSKHLHVSRPSKSKIQPAPPTIVTPRYPAPYPTHRNRSAPAVATMLNTPMLKTPMLKGGPYGYPRDDTPSLSDGSAHRARPSGSYKHSLSIRSNRSNALPSSSDPPSSSNPPTPRDTSFANPMIVAAHSSTSALGNKRLMPPNAPVSYYDYTEDFELEKEVTEVFNETLPDSPMPFGFLERIKAILEERERSANGTMSIDSSNMGVLSNSMNDSMPPGLAELPATPVGAKRITRELIMAALAPSSDSLEPDSVIETVTSMISTPTLADCSLAVEPSSTPDDSDVEDYHSVASRAPSHLSRHSQARLPLDVFGSHRLANRSMQSLASLIPDELEDNIPPVPQLPLRMSPIRPPPVIPAANELIIDKVQRHWSLRRAALGPACTVETVSHRFIPMKPPSMPTIASSSSHKSQNSSATVDTNVMSSHEHRISYETKLSTQAATKE